jgi:MFS family permease
MGAHDGLPGRAPLTAQPLGQRHPALGLAIVGLGASLAPLDIAVNVALPAITAFFRLALGDVQWLVICYVLVYGSLMLVCGKLGDLFGHRLIFRIGLGVSAVGCAACAAAPDWHLFLAARALQGVGTALAISCTPALAVSLYPPAGRLSALAAFSMTVSLASTVGPMLGGVLVELGGWPAVYWVRVPIALVALALSALLPQPNVEARPFDFWGGVLVAAAMSSFLFALVLAQRPEVSSWLALAVFAVSLGLTRWYVARSRTVAEPIIRPTLFADPAFAIPNVMNALASLAAFAILLLTPYYLINVLQLPPTLSGLVLAAAYVAALAGAPVAAWLVPRIGRRQTVFAGVALIGLALIPLGLTDAGTPLALVALLLAAEGLGMGLLGVSYTDLVVDTLPAHDRGVAGSLALLTRTIGNVSGASVLSALFAAGSAGGFLAGYRFAFHAAGGGLLAILALSCLWRRAWFGR